MFAELWALVNTPFGAAAATAACGTLWYAIKSGKAAEWWKWCCSRVRGLEPLLVPFGAEAADDGDVFAPENRCFAGIIDRSAEIARLERFVDDSERTLGILVIAGENGSGKSRLAIDFCHEVMEKPGKKENWNVRALTPGFLEETAQIRWRPKKNILLFIDDAATYGESLLKWFEKLLRDDSRGGLLKRKKIRIVLMERAADFAPGNNWLGRLYARLRECRLRNLDAVFGNQELLRIPPLERDAREAAMRELIAKRSIAPKEGEALVAKTRKDEKAGTAQNLIVMALHKSGGEQEIRRLAEKKIHRMKNLPEELTLKDRAFYCNMLLGVMLCDTVNENTFWMFFNAERNWWEKTFGIRLGESLPKGREFDRDCGEFFLRSFGGDTEKNRILRSSNHNILKGEIIRAIGNYEGYAGNPDALSGLPARCYEATGNTTIFSTLVGTLQEFRKEPPDDPLRMFLEKGYTELIPLTKTSEEIEAYLRDFPKSSPKWESAKLALLERRVLLADGNSPAAADAHVTIAKIKSTSLRRDDLQDALTHARTARSVYEGQEASLPSTRAGQQKKIAETAHLECVIQMNFEKDQESRRKNALRLANIALDIYREFPATPESVECLRDRGSIYEKLGEGENALQDLDNAVRESERQLERMQRGDPLYEKWLFTAASSSLERGRVLSIFGVPEPVRDPRDTVLLGTRNVGMHQPLTDTATAVERYRELVETDPDTYKPYLAEALNQLGDREREYGIVSSEGSEKTRYENSIEYSVEAVGIYEPLYADGANMRYGAGLAGCYVNLFKRYKHIGDYSTSFKYIKKANTIREHLYQDNNVVYKKERIESLALLAKEEWLRGSFPEAIEHIDDAINMLGVEDPGESRASRELRPKILELYVFILIRQGKLIEAEKQATKALAISGEFIKRYPRATKKYWNDHVDLLIHLSDIQRRRGEPGLAKASADKAFTFLRTQGAFSLGEDFTVQKARAQRRRAKAVLQEYRIGVVIDSEKTKTQQTRHRECGEDLRDAVERMVSIENHYSRNRIRLIGTYIDYARPALGESNYEAAETTLHTASMEIQKACGKFSEFEKLYDEMEGRLAFTRGILYLRDSAHHGDAGDAITQLEKCDEKYTKLMHAHTALLYYVYYLVDCRLLAARIHIKAGNKEKARAAIDAAKGLLEGNKERLTTEHSKSYFELNIASCENSRNEFRKQFSNHGAWSVS